MRREPVGGRRSPRPWSGRRFDTEQALSSSVAFTLVGQPKDARRIAGCQDGRLYALNADKSLWISPNGADGTWTWVNTPPRR